MQLRTSAEIAALQHDADMLASHMLRQGRRAVRDARELAEGVGDPRPGKFAYHAPDGAKCPAGFLIDEGHYTPTIEGLTCEASSIRAIIEGLGYSVSLCSKFQKIHDTIEPDRWREAIEGVFVSLQLDTSSLSAPEKIEGPRAQPKQIAPSTPQPPQAEPKELRPWFHEMEDEMFKVFKTRRGAELFRRHGTVWEDPETGEKTRDFPEARRVAYDLSERYDPTPDEEGKVVPPRVFFRMYFLPELRRVLAPLEKFEMRDAEALKERLESERAELKKNGATYEDLVRFDLKHGTTGAMTIEERESRTNRPTDDMNVGDDTYSAFESRLTPGQRSILRRLLAGDSRRGVASRFGEDKKEIDRVVEKLKGKLEGFLDTEGNVDVPRYIESVKLKKSKSKTKTSSVEEVPTHGKEKQ